MAVLGTLKVFMCIHRRKKILSNECLKLYHVVKQNIFGNPERTVFICTPKEDNPIKLPLPQ